MQNASFSTTRSGLLLTLLILGIVTVLIVVPSQFRPAAGVKTGEGLFSRTVSSDDGLDKMWDIREAGKADTTPVDVFAKFRESVGKNASAVADVRDGFVRGEAEITARLPQVKIEYNTDIRIPEVIAPDAYDAKIQFLSSPSSEKRSEILRNFVKENDNLVGINHGQADALKVVADYANPSGNMAFAHLEQVINGVEVFRGEIKAGFTMDGRLVRVINNLAPGLDYQSLSTNFHDPLDAVRVAAQHIKHELRADEVNRNDAASTANKVVFGTGDFATTAERMYFPTEPGVAVPSWRVLIWQPTNAYYVIVDAADGVVLWHKNITDDQASSATFQVYNNTPAYINVADSPAPLTPGILDPALGTQGALIASRTNITLIGNEPPNAFNNNGWVTDGTNFTDGNAVQAGIDRVAPSGVDAPQDGDSTCPGAGCRVFTSTWNPPPGNPGPGDEPLTVQAQRGAVIQMFYVMNRYHDELYKLGFTELARNFQHDNFGRGGVANDRVSAEGQDSSGTNNANFSTPADGGRGVMQMYLWTGPTPDKDGTADADVIIHEVTHGTSNRLHGNGSGLGGMGGMMGEGWGDWYGHTMLSEPTDPINGIYTTGGYATHLLGGFTANFYYGIRRWPKAVIAFTGGPARPGCNNLPCPHNPFTFKHINSNCDTTLGTTAAAVSSAFPRSPVIATSGSCNQVHNAGEIWSSALWEVRALMIGRLGFAVGTQRVLQVVLDGMKLAPLNPTFIQERDAIITAAAALRTPEASADVVDVREGFRRRGMGFSASVQSTSAVTEAFDFPNVAVVNPFTVSDSPGDNDGFPEPGENVLLNVSISNTTGASISGVMANVNGGTNVNYGTINDGQTVSMPIPYTVPGGAACGSLHQVTINVTSSVGPQTPVIREFRLGAPVGGAPVTFTNSTPLVIPGTGTGPGPSAPYGTTITTSGLTGNKNIRLELTGISHTFPGDIDILLVGPGGQKFIPMSDAGNSLDAVNVTTQLVDSAAAIIPSADSTINGEFRPTNHTAGDTYTAPAPAAPYLSPAPIGTETFATAFGTAGAALNGTWTLYVMDDAGVDVGEMDGWKLTFEANDYECILVTVPDTRADFDGDGKTDLSVFRPSEGNWYLNRSTAGFTALGWGISTDTLVPGDYDADGKTDTAVFRASNSASSPDFYILNSNGFTVTGLAWGIVGDTPVVSDYDGDGKTDVAVYRSSSNTWFVLNSSNGANYIEPFGVAGDVPMAMDTNGDGKAQVTVFRPSNNTWYIARPTGTPATNFDALPFGTSGDRLVPADYDGDNKDDVAVYRPSNGTWYVRKSTDGTTSTTAFGASTDTPVPGDYDGDGKDDVAVYRNGTWYVLRSTAGLLVQPFGLSTDTPIPAKYIP